MISRRTILGAAAASAATSVLLADTPLAPPSMGASSGSNFDPITANVGRTSLNTPAQTPGVPGKDYTPIHTPNGSTLPFTIVDGAKVMHLIAGPCEHEFTPGLKAKCWGFNGVTPGPTIEAVAGDRLRIYVTNQLPAPTAVHWHGIRVPNGMDGVNGLTQPAIAPGETYRYEFVVPEAGTFMYHPHFDEMTQQGLGMMGMFIVHPRPGAGGPGAAEARPDRDYVIMLSEWRMDPGATRPNPIEMVDFNILTMNSKVYPSTEPIVAQMGERVRIRFGNLGAMDHHPIHLHGFQMTLVETDGGALPASARFAANTVLVPVGSTRAVEFIADNPGDWPMHCHMTHHTMNQMGHDSPNMVDANMGGIDDKIRALVPGYMSMGQNGMEEMTDMSGMMPVPANSIPMLGGHGQFGTIDMGGMFTLVKVREKLTGFGDPGNYAFPPNTLARPATPEELRRDGIDL
jgi:FtsP/CotA-like multicopper oxidase with cupredoxin domain